MRPDPRRARSPAQLTCPTCGRRCSIDQSPTPPFCSERCQQIDLGRWLDEDIGLPIDPGEEVPEDDGSPGNGL